MEVEKENQNVTTCNEMDVSETKTEPKVENTEEKGETTELVGHGGQGKLEFPSKSTLTGLANL